MKSVLAISFLALAAIATALPAVAMPSGEQMAAYEAAPENERVKLLITLAKSGREEEVRALLAAYPLTGRHAKNRLLFIDGLLQKASGDLTGSVETFRAVLADDASLTLVRAELAQTLVVLEQDDSAKHHFNLLANDAPDEKAAGSVRAFIDQIDSRKSFTKSAFIAVAPNTNVNNGSKHETVYGNGIAFQTTEPESGIGALVGGSLGFSRRLGNDFSFVAAGNGEARVYKNSDNNSYSLSQSAEIRRLIEGGYFSLGAVASQYLENDKLGVSTWTLGPRVGFSYQVTKRDHFANNLTLEWRENTDKTATDSAALMYNSAWTHGFSSSLTTTLTGGVDIVDTGLEPTSYVARSVGVSVYKELPSGISATISADISDTKFIGLNTSIGEKRRDIRGTAAINLTKRDFNIFGFAPSIRYGFSENFSNLDIYDVRTHAVDFRLTKDF